MSYNPLPQPATSVVLTGAGTSAVSFSNPFPVSLGSSSITIVGSITIPTTVSVASSPANPVHSHITEVGTSDILNVPYLPIGIGTTNLNLTYLPVGISTLLNTVSISNTSFYITNPVTTVAVSSITSNVTVQGTVGIGTTGQVSLNLNSAPVSSSNPLPVTGTLGISTTSIVSVTLPSTQTDAFNRLRTSNPLTLFDSSNRYRDNNLFTTLSVGTGSTVGFVTTQGLVNLAIGTTAGCSVTRETTKVFAYQPGKSLEVMNTVVMNQPQAHLTQRVGYYGADNGIYFEAQGTTLNFVERSIVTGTQTETRTPQSSWLYDKLDGTGPSGYTLDASKAQIFWMDIEWLGVGSVRVGFVIDGKFIHCHSFHHANRISSTYITTAALPLRYELFNTGISTTGISTMKQICSTVISEGGYELRGLQQATATPITSPIALTTAGTYYTIISLRLKTSPNRLDAIAILTAISILGITNNTNYTWQVRASGTSSGGTWVDAGVDSCMEYKIGGGTYSGGRILASGFLNGSNQGSSAVDILKEALFKFQLERDSLNGIPYELTLIAAADSNSASIHASMDWEEVSR